jgi:hypothetical protein
MVYCFRSRRAADPFHWKDGASTRIGHVVGRHASDCIAGITHSCEQCSRSFATERHANPQVETRHIR